MVGGVRRHWALARFCQVFHTGLLASFRMSEILELAGDASQSARLREAGHRAAHSLEAGDLLTNAMKKTGAFPRAFIMFYVAARIIGMVLTLYAPVQKLLDDI
jgi:type II secretory pathway component PulF